jgi:hypothetical protein
MRKIYGKKKIGDVIGYVVLFHRDAFEIFNNPSTHATNAVNVLRKGHETLNFKILSPKPISLLCQLVYLRYCMGTHTHWIHSPYPEPLDFKQV